MARGAVRDGARMSYMGGMVALVGLAVTALAGCRHLFQVCGPSLVITPTFDSTSVGGTRTFAASVDAGGCGLAKSETTPARAVWRVQDPTVVRISAITADDVVTVTGLRRGESAIGASAQGLSAA